MFNIKTKVLVLIGILIIAFAAMVAPVMAATTGVTALTGNPALQISITLNEAAIPLTLTPGSSAVDSSLTATVSANKAFTVTVADNTGRPVAVQGFMGNYTTSYDQGSNALNTTLASAMQLAGTSSGTTTANTITPPITDTPQTLYTGSAAVNNQVLANTFTQPVGLLDVVLPVGSSYRLDLIYTITAS